MQLKILHPNVSSMLYSIQNLKNHAVCFNRCILYSVFQVFKVIFMSTREISSMESAEISAFRTNKTEKAFSLIGLRMNDKVLMTACCSLLEQLC